MPSGASSRIISPREAFFTPTRSTSERPTSENQRTKRMKAPWTPNLRTASVSGNQVQRVPAPHARALGSKLRKSRFVTRLGVAEGTPLRSNDMTTRWMTLVPAFALAACAGLGGSENNASTSQTSKAQTQAASAFQRAADAQK